MTTTTRYAFAKAKRPATKKEIMHSRLRHAKASLAVEGLHLTREEVTVFETCIQRGCTLEERTTLLKERFPGYDYAIRA